MRDRATIVQKKTGRPVQFEITEQSRTSVEAWLPFLRTTGSRYLFPSRLHASPHISTRQYARLVRAGVNWNPGVVGHAKIPAQEGSPAGCALHTNQPVITEDTEREVRFEIPKLLIEHSVRSTVNVVIRGEEGPFGVLEVDSRQLREFEQDDIDFLQNYANLLKAEKLNASICFPLCPQQRTSTKHKRHV